MMLEKSKNNHLTCLSDTVETDLREEGDLGVAWEARSSFVSSPFSPPVTQTTNSKILERNSQKRMKQKSKQHLKMVL